MQRDISRQARAERTRGGHGGEITIKNHFASAEEDNCASDTQGNSREYERWGVCTQPRRLARPEPHSLQEGDTGKGEVAQAHEQWRLRRSLLTLTLLPFLKLFICVFPRERETQRGMPFRFKWHSFFGVEREGPSTKRQRISISVPTKWC